MRYISEHNRKWWVLIGVSIASFLGCIDFTIVNTALPAIQVDLHATVTQLQWVVNMFLLALCSFMVIMGRLADIYGRRRVLYLGALAFGIASLAAGLANDISWLIAFRFLQGIACAVLYTVTGAIVADAFPEDQRGRAIGLLFGANGLGLALGPVLGGVIVASVGWRWIFLVNVPLILISLMICLVSVRESVNKEEGSKIDWGGAVLLVVGLSGCVLTMTQGSGWGWSSLETLGTLTISVLALISFYYVEQRVDSPILDFHLLANRLFLSAATANAALAFFYCLAFFLMPLYLNLIKGLGDLQVGLMLLPTTAVVAILSPIVGRLIERTGAKLFLVSGFAFFALSALIQGFFSEGSSLLQIALAFACMGVGWACILGPATVVALSAVPANMGAVAMESSWTIHNLGGAIGLSAGLLVHQEMAASQLLNTLSSNNAVTEPMAQTLLASPETAVSELLKLGVPEQQAAEIFHSSFMFGYHSSMWLLLLISAMAMVVLFFTLPTKRSVRE
ncbi:MFS transporter [Serratia sp. (in: enterobacteria)]|uniref:MFS transporter n=1 Tax=Serratia sp. (in: enterobacteria) TaxID=616 RepID=UPI00398A4A26